MSERKSLGLTGIGLMLTTVGALLAASNVGFEIVQPLCIGSGVLLVAVAQFHMMRIPCENPEEDEGVSA